MIVADQRMPDMTGVEFLRHTLVPLPHAVRIILTGFTDVEVLMEAINSCKVFRYIVKPWDPPDLLMTVERGLEAHQLAVENERFRRELVRRERLARELEIAREIQRYILPPECPSIENYEMAVEYHPAREVGGDLYDFDWDPATGTLQVVIGDVSGKSIPAALYGAVFSGQMRTLFAHSTSPAQMLAFLNRQAGPPVSGRELHSRGPPLSQRRRRDRTSCQRGNALSLPGARRSGVETGGGRSSAGASGRVGVRRNRS